MKSWEYVNTIMLTEATWILDTKRDCTEEVECHQAKQRVGLPEGVDDGGSFLEALFSAEHYIVCERSSLHNDSQGRALPYLECMWGCFRTSKKACNWVLQYQGWNTWLSSCYQSILVHKHWLYLCSKEEGCLSRQVQAQSTGKSYANQGPKIHPQYPQQFQLRMMLPSQWLPSPGLLTESRSKSPTRIKSPTLTRSEKSLEGCLNLWRWNGDILAVELSQQSDLSCFIVDPYFTAASSETVRQKHKCYRQ